MYTNLRMKESFHDSRASAVKTKFKKLPIVRRIRRVPRNFRGKWNFTRLNTCELCTIWIRHVQHAPWSMLVSCLLLHSLFKLRGEYPVRSVFHL